MNHYHRFFIRKNTKLGSPPLVPEIKLHLAVDATELWKMTTKELKDNGLPLPFWAFAWAGGQALARYILDNPQLVEDKSVLDLGAGSGLVGLSALFSNASQVDFKEIDCFAAEAIHLNLSANQLDQNFKIILEHLPKFAPRNQNRWDVILAGDVFYEQEMSNIILSDLRKFARLGNLVLVGDPGRTYFPKEGVKKLAQYPVETPIYLEEQNITETTIWQIVPMPQVILNDF